MIESTHVVIVGHVDHGKSTFIGRLLHDTGNLSPDRLADIKKASEEKGGRLEFAFVTDQFQEEREANVTIDTSQIFLALDKRPFVLIDAPGHKEYLKNMITGATQADNAILMLDVNEGVREQTDKHARILKLLGLEGTAVFINKMDAVQFREEAFRAHEGVIRELLARRGVRAEAVVPLSAYEGDNVATRSPRMPWYNGPTALEFLVSCRPVHQQSAASPVRFPVQLVHAVNGETLVLGRVESGTIHAGQSLHMFPEGETVSVRAIRRWRESDGDSAAAGDSIALSISSTAGCARGRILCGDRQSPFRRVRLQAFWAGQEPLTVGDVVRVDCRTQSVQGRIASLRDELAEEKISSLSPGDIALLELEPSSPILLSRFGDDPGFGRVVLARAGDNGCGVVIDVE